MTSPEILYSVKAQRGDTLRCKGWRQEAILRLLENNMENAEYPERLVVYGGVGKAARNWESYHAIVDTLQRLEDNETLVVQSGMPVAVFRTHQLAPRVIMANTNLIKPTWEKFYDLQDKNLTMFAQYTAAPWEYIGTQGVIQGTFQTLAAIAELHYDGDLSGRLLVTAGMGGMGGNQTRAMTMHGGVCICADVDRRIIERRLDVGFCDVIVDTFDEAWSLAQEAIAEKRPLGIALVANAVDMHREIQKRDLLPDIVTDMTPAHDPLAYIPAGMTLEAATDLRDNDRGTYIKAARESMVEQLSMMNSLYEKGSHVFEYGNQIRAQSREGGFEDSMRIPGFVAAYIRPLFCEGRGPFRWICLSGSADDLSRIDDLVLELFGDDELTRRWITLAREQLPIEGLPARICYLGYGQRARLGLAVNELVRNGELRGPVAFSRDNLDSGSIVNPTFESEDMADGGDDISDWPYLNALLNTAAMADLVAIQANYAMAESVQSAVTMVADGSEQSDLRLEASLSTDPGIGVVRHAQAGYERAREVADAHHMDVPLWWTPTATFGPTA